MSNVVVNQHQEREVLGTNNSKRNKNIIPGSTKCNESFCCGQKAYVLGTSMVESIRRIEFNSFLWPLRKYNTRFRSIIGAFIIYK